MENQPRNTQALPPTTPTGAHPVITPTARHEAVCGVLTGNTDRFLAVGTIASPAVRDTDSFAPVRPITARIASPVLETVITDEVAIPFLDLDSSSTMKFPVISYEDRLKIQKEAADLHFSLPKTIKSGFRQDFVSFVETKLESIVSQLKSLGLTEDGINYWSAVGLRAEVQRFLEANNQVEFSQSFCGLFFSNKIQSKNHTKADFDDFVATVDPSRRAVKSAKKPQQTRVATKTPQVKKPSGWRNRVAAAAIVAAGLFGLSRLSPDQVEGQSAEISEVTVDTVTPEVEATLIAQQNEAPKVLQELPVTEAIPAQEAETQEPAILFSDLVSLYRPVALASDVDYSTIGTFPDQIRLFETQQLADGVAYLPVRNRNLEGVQAAVITSEDNLNVRRVLNQNSRFSLPAVSSMPLGTVVTLSNNFEYAIDGSTIITYVQVQGSNDYVALPYLTQLPVQTAATENVEAPDLETQYASFIGRQVEYTSQAGNTKSYQCQKIENGKMTLSLANNPSFSFEVKLSTLAARSNSIKLASSESISIQANEVDMISAETGARCYEVTA